MTKEYLKIALICLILPIIFWQFSRKVNPFKEVEWIQDSPGATGRCITFTPVLKSNHNVKLGPTVGADYAELKFEDVNNDGTEEAIIETNSFFHFEMYQAERYILSYQKRLQGDSTFVVIKREELKK